MDTIVINVIAEKLYYILLGGSDLFLSVLLINVWQLNLKPV